MPDQDTPARIEFLNWKDAQLETIFTQIETAYPNLLLRIDAIIETAHPVRLLATLGTLEKAIDKTTRDWADEQARLALAHTEGALADLKAQLTPDVALDPDLLARLAAALPAIAGAGLATASVAAIPTITSFATITTSTFAIFAISTVSWPLFAVGAVGVVATAYVGRSLIGRSIASWRRSLRDRAHSLTAIKVFGLGAKPGQTSILEVIQGFAIKTAANNLGTVE